VARGLWFADLGPGGLSSSAWQEGAWHRLRLAKGCSKNEHMHVGIMDDSPPALQPARPAGQTLLPLPLPGPLWENCLTSLGLRSQL
jgi:hypothetical protein